MPETPAAVCNTYDEIIDNQGAVINNSDGSISVFVKNNVGVLIPFPLTEKCCNVLNSSNPSLGAYWDGPNQKCKWNGAPQNTNDTCSLDSVFKLVLNPNGNDGALVTLSEDSHLDISFDYLFKFTCESLNALTLGAANILNFTLHRTTGNGNWSDHLVLKFANTNVTFADFQIIVSNPTVAFINAAIAAGTVTNGYTLTCVSVNNPATTISFQLTTNNNSVVGTTVTAVSDPFVTTTVNNWITNNNGGGGGGGGPFGGGSGNGAICNAVQALETLDVSMTLDIVNGVNSVTVLEIPIFQSMGQNNLQFYLNSHPNNSGFFICGDPVNGDPSNLTACSPLVVSGTNSSNVYTCNTLLGFIKSEIGQNIPVNAFNSEWLNFNTTITNQSVLNQIKNKKVKLGIKVNDACANFCVLLDNIELGINFTTVNSTNIFITQSPGFVLDRIRDNKKSWIKNTSLTQREFEIARNNGSNLIRGTKYGVNDERLVINSKEIDLDISLASAIETDVWKYMVDNPCLLTATTCSNSNLIVNGTFDTDLSSWSGFSGGVPVSNTWFWDSGKAKYDGDISVGALYQKIIGLENGNQYQLTFTFSDKIGASDFFFSFLDSTLHTISSNGTYSIINTYDSSSVSLFKDGVIITSASGSLTGAVDNVSVTLVCSATSCTGSTCGDNGVDYAELITQPLSAITVVEDFEFLISSELIDAKNRKTLSGYPTLRGLYDRYLNSTLYCSQISSGFNYLSVDQFANLVGNYWVDIIEQVVPATTIWGATKIYSNTIFDSQKYKYKAYTLLGGSNPFIGITVSSPVSGTSTGVSVVATNLTNSASTTPDIFTNPYIIQMNSGSEFIGTVAVVGNNGNQNNMNNQNGQTLFAG